MVYPDRSKGATIFCATVVASGLGRGRGGAALRFGGVSCLQLRGRFFNGLQRFKEAHRSNDEDEKAWRVRHLGSRVIKAHRVTGNQRPKVPKVRVHTILQSRTRQF